MIDLKRMIDLFSEKLGKYNTYPHIYRKNPERIALHLYEEIGEIARTFRKAKYDISVNPDSHHLALAEELADGVILIGLLASSVDINLDEAVRSKLHKNYQEGKVLLDVDSILGLRCPVCLCTLVGCDCRFSCSCYELKNCVCVDNLKEISEVSQNE